MGLWGQPEPDGDERGAGRALRDHGARLLVALAIAAATVLLFPSAPAVELPLYEVGSVAPDNVLAPFAFRRSGKTDAAIAPERQRIGDGVGASVPGRFDRPAERPPFELDRDAPFERVEMLVEAVLRDQTQLRLNAVE